VAIHLANRRIHARALWQVATHAHWTTLSPSGGARQSFCECQGSDPVAGSTNRVASRFADLIPESIEGSNAMGSSNVYVSQ
jgi:hypothetical protein